MNKKQRVLTICALIVFVVIGACHYLAWPPINLFGQETYFYGQWEELTFEEAAAKSGHPADAGSPMLPYFAEAIKHQLHDEEAAGLHKAGGAYTEAEAGIPPRDAKAWVPIDTTKSVWNPYLRFTDDWRYAMIRDVRVPWFMLGVVYVGLFFLLADQKEKKP